MLSIPAPSRPLRILLFAALAAAPLAACAPIVSPEAEAALRAARADATLGVYPVLVHRGPEFLGDADQAARIVEGLEGAGFRRVAAAAGPAPSIRVPWRMNEARMFRASAEGLAAHVAARPPAEEYVLYAEYLIGSDGGKVLAAHWMIADRGGRIAAAGLYNSHQEIFRRVNPVDLRGCTQMVIEGVKQEIGP